MHRVEPAALHKVGVPSRANSQVTGIAVYPIQGELGDEYCVIEVELAYLDGSRHRNPDGIPNDPARLLCPKFLLSRLRDDLDDYR